MALDGPITNEGVKRELESTDPDLLQGQDDRFGGLIQREALALDKSPRRGERKWWLVASVLAVLVALLAAAGLYLLTRTPSTVDQLVILTVPSGAEIKLDSKPYGSSPVKLEQIPIGTYTIEITKEGFESVREVITVSESQPLEYRLKPAAATGTVGLSPEELISRFTGFAEESFARGHHALPYENSALYYADSILFFEQSNQFASEMRERVRRSLHQAAQTATSRGDLARAQEIYRALIDNFDKDEEARQGAQRVEGQLVARRGEVRDLVRKAEEALAGGRLIEPARESAYFYSNQALAIDRQNSPARAVRNRVKETLSGFVEQANARGEFDQAILQQQRLVDLFPDDRALAVRLRELREGVLANAPRDEDGSVRRQRGLERYQREEFAEAVKDLEYAVVSGLSGPDVVFALARSYMKLGNLDKAQSYFRQVPESSNEAYRSAIAALGDIAYQRGDSAQALERYKEARRMGGSLLYPVPQLDDKIERIEKKQREKAAEPKPLSIEVRHLHGGLRGSCRGALTVDGTGVRYEGEHTYSANFAGLGAGKENNDLVIQFLRKSERFRASPGDAERFIEALSRYQNFFSVSK